MSKSKKVVAIKATDADVMRIAGLFNAPGDMTGIFMTQTGKPATLADIEAVQKKAK